MDANDENYNSASDEDFNPEEQDAASDAADSSSDEDRTASSKGQRKRKSDAEELDFDNSGDEATVQKFLRKKKRRKGPADAQNDDDDSEGGDGGLIKTRAQRRVEVKEKRPLVQTNSSTVDIDAIWSQMSKGASSIPATTQHPPQNGIHNESSGTQNETHTPNPSTSHAHPSTIKQDSQTPASAGAAKNITITRSYEFAGEKIQEERVVPADSAEAKLYLEEQARTGDAPAASQKQAAVNRPLKRRSKFDPPAQPGGGAPAVPPNPLLAARGKKLNTIDKSKLDWAVHVDKEGISEELDEHRKAKDAYLGRMDFLGRMDAKREDDHHNRKGS